MSSPLLLVEELVVVGASSRRVRDAERLWWRSCGTLSWVVIVFVFSSVISIAVVVQIMIELSVDPGLTCVNLEM